MQSTSTRLSSVKPKRRVEEFPSLPTPAIATASKAVKGKRSVKDSPSPSVAKPTKCVQEESKVKYSSFEEISPAAAVVKPMTRLEGTMEVQYSPSSTDESPAALKVKPMTRLEGTMEVQFSPSSSEESPVAPMVKPMTRLEGTMEAQFSPSSADESLISSPAAVKPVRRTQKRLMEELSSLLMESPTKRLRHLEDKEVSEMSNSYDSDSCNSNVTFASDQQDVENEENINEKVDMIIN